MNLFPFSLDSLFMVPDSPSGLMRVFQWSFHFITLLCQSASLRLPWQLLYHICSDLLLCTIHFIVWFSLIMLEFCLGGILLDTELQCGLAVLSFL